MKIIAFYKNLKLSQKLLIVMLTVPVILSLSLLYLSAKRVIEGKNKPNQVIAESTAQGVIDKIERNLYERYGDVQAFAFNQLAINALQEERTSLDFNRLQRFVNTMTTYYVIYDLMIIADRNGKIIMVNTVDKHGQTINSDYLLDNDVKNTAWFTACTLGSGPAGGAYYTDFGIDDNVARIYNNDGYGIGYAAPIKDNDGKIIGVWYNRANWADITQGIREEAEIILQESEPDVRIYITDKDGKIIDAADRDLILENRIVREKFILGEPIVLGSKIITNDTYILGWGKSRGAYTYRGNKWNAITLFPKSQLTIQTFFSKELTGLIIFILIMMLIAILISSFYAKYIFTKINEVKNAIISLTQGKFPPKIEVESNDEIGQISESFNSLVFSLQESQRFAEELGKGNLDASFTLSNRDVLAQTLLIVQESLKKAEHEENLRKQEEEKRSWTTHGLAIFSEILRNSINNREELANSIIAEMVKYTKSNQGALYILEDDNEAGKEPYIEMIACYAWNKKKHNIQRRFELGEGLVGQCVLDKATLMLTEVPKDYIAITSGLGEDVPRCLLFVPLVLNDVVYGIIELASFNVYEKHVIEFIEKIGESIASTMQGVKINAKTAFLLEQSQMQAEEMKAQEEEMRQNLEELHATQEQLNQAAIDQKHQIESLNKQLREKTALLDQQKKELEEYKNAIQSQSKEQVEQLKKKLADAYQQMADLNHQIEQLKTNKK